jgi:multimeric flavodoxin WrbA
MRALIVEASLKPLDQESNTRAVCRVAQQSLKGLGVDTLVQHLKGMQYDFSTEIVNDQGQADDMTQLLKTVLDADILVIATPIWWGIHSSLAQSFIERMDKFDDWSQKKNTNVMGLKTLGTIVSGSGDGFQHIHGLHSAFASYLGFTVPPKSMLECNTQGYKKILQDRELKTQASKWAENLVRCSRQLQQR